MNKEKQELVVQETTAIEASQSPIAAMQMLLDKNVDPEKIEKMLALQEMWDAVQAKKAYTQAMAEFKLNPPTILKDKKVGFTSQRTGGTTSYNHATLGNVTNKVNTALAKHGFSSGWKTEQKEGQVTVTCTITHKMGHSESTSLFAGADTSGQKNSIQAVGSTITYLQRYTLLTLTGLATHDQDDDGAYEEPEYITEDQVLEIREMLKGCGFEPALLKHLGVDSIDHIEKLSYSKTIEAINNKKTYEAAQKKETAK